MRVEVSYEGVAKNRIYYATPATAGRPRKGMAIKKSKKPFATGKTRSEAIQNLLDLIGFTASDDQ